LVFFNRPFVNLLHPFCLKLPGGPSEFLQVFSLPFFFLLGAFDWRAPGIFFFPFRADFFDYQSRLDFLWCWGFSVFGFSGRLFSSRSLFPSCATLWTPFSRFTARSYCRYFNKTSSTEVASPPFSRLLLRRPFSPALVHLPLDAVHRRPLPSPSPHSGFLWKSVWFPAPFPPPLSGLHISSGCVF